MEKIEFENRLLDAIKRDDLKSFTLLMPTNADLNLCYGRFPILSLLYLYSSFKILSRYERVLMPIHNFKFVEERNEIYKVFRKRAKRTLRLFNDEGVVYPILMLAVLNERSILKHNFKFLFKNAEINSMLSKIYKINHNLNIGLDGESIKIPTERITKNQKIWVCLFSVVVCLFVALSSVAMVFVKNSTGIGTKKSPIKVSTAQEFLSALKYGNRSYVIEDDITIEGSDFSCRNFSGTINGNDHTISIEGEIESSLIKNMSGSIENLNLKLLENEVKITQNWAVLAENSSGKFKNIKISGSFNGDYNSTEEIFAGALTSNNAGEILNCDIEISVTLKNSNQSNAYFGNITGVNSGKIVECGAKQGIVSADTVDLAGIACENNGEILNCENGVTLIQTSNKEWHPNIGGISISNKGIILNCKNKAELNASSTTEDNSQNNYYVFVGGISCENYGEIKNARNTGNLFAKGKISNIVAGGIAAQNIDDQDEMLAGKIDFSLSLGSTLTANSEKGQICVGGVVGLNATSLTNSGFIGTIDANSTARENKEVFVSKVERFSSVYAGGIVGINQYSELRNCYTDVSYLADGEALVPVSDSEPLKIYAGIVGSVNIYIYTDGLNHRQSTTFDKISNNFYVDKPEIEKYAYGLIAYGSFYISQYGVQFDYLSGALDAIDETILGANNTIFNKCESLSDEKIPFEVVYE